MFHYIALDSASRSSQLVNSVIGSLVAVIPSSGVAFKKNLCIGLVRLCFLSCCFSRSKRPARNCKTLQKPLHDKAVVANCEV